MYKVYLIHNELNGKCYVGMTQQPLSKRWSQHKQNCKTKGTYLYNSIRKHGSQWFSIETLSEHSSREECCDAEILAIRQLQPEYNLTSGGDGGWCVQDVEGWRRKIRESRAGRKPALGMSHTDENKKVFSEVSRKYWDSQETYDPEEVVKYSHKEAKQKFGISTTHYYRLRRMCSEHS